MRPSRALARQSLDSSTIWWWMKLSTPSASGRMFSGEKERMNSASFPSICVVAWRRSRVGEGWCGAVVAGGGGGGTWMSGTTKDGGLASERRVTLGLASSAWHEVKKPIWLSAPDMITSFWISSPLCVSFFFSSYVRIRAPCSDEGWQCKTISLFCTTKRVRGHWKRKYPITSRYVQGEIVAIVPLQSQSYFCFFHMFILNGINLA